MMSSLSIPAWRERTSASEAYETIEEELLSTNTHPLVELSARQSSSAIHADTLEKTNAKRVSQKREGERDPKSVESGRAYQLAVMGQVFNATFESHLEDTLALANLQMSGAHELE